MTYVPGGGFIEGDKRAEDGFYANIGYYFAARGFLVLIMDYRLAPVHSWPAGGEDVGYALGKRARCIVWRRPRPSCHLWALVRRQPCPNMAVRSGPQKYQPVSAVVLASCTYRVGGEDVRPNVIAYFGSDPSQYKARSPITHVHRTNVPLLLTVSELDPPFLASPTFELAAKLTDANGRPPQVVWLAGHNHVSNVLSIGTADNVAANLVANFLRIHDGPK